MDEPIPEQETTPEYKSKWKHRLTRFREKGLSYAFERIKTRLHTSYRERQLRISTCGFIPWNELFDEEQNHDYVPTSCRLLDKALNYIQQTVSEP